MPTVGKALGIGQNVIERMVTVRIHLFDTKTGLAAWHEYKMDSARADDPDDPEAFWWTNGNAGCDCERARILYAQLGKPDPNVACGNSRVCITDATVDGIRRESWCDKSELFDGSSTQV